MADKTLVFEISAVAREYRRAMKEAVSSTRKLGAQTVDTSAVGSRSFSKLSTAAQGLTRHLRAAASILIAGGVAGGVLKASSTFETLSASLLFVEGSAEAATARIKELSRFARKNGQDIEQVIDSYVRLKNLGLDPSLRSLKAFLNVAAATRGKSLIDFIEAVADAVTGEFERLKEFGIKARVEGDRVALTFQGQTTTIENNARSIQSALRQIGEVQFAGAVESQLNTTAAATKRAGAATKSLFATIGDVTGFNEGVRVAAQAWASVAENLSQTQRAAQGAKSEYTGLTKLVLDGVQALNNYIDKVQTEKYGVDPGLDGEAKLNALLERRGELLAAIKQQTQEVAQAAQNSPIREAFFPTLPREQAELRKLKTDLQQVEGLISGAMDQALDEVDNQFKELARDSDQTKVKVAQFGAAGVEAFRAIADEAKALKSEFDELDDFLGKVNVDLPASLANVSALRDKALGQIGTGDAEGAIQTLRQAKDLLRQVAEEGKESSLFLDYWAKTLRRVAEQAVAAKSKAAKLSQADFGAAAPELQKVAKAADEAQESISDINTVNVTPPRGIAEIEDAATGLKKTLDDLPQDGLELEDNAPEVKSEIKGIEDQIRALTVDDHVIKIRVQYDENGVPTFSDRATGGPIPGYASGGRPRRLRPGMIRGPGTTTSDSILARVSRGEHAFITNAARAKQLWPLLNQLNFGSDALVRQVLDALRTGLALKSAQIPSLNLGSAFIKPLPAPVGAYASGGPVTASSSSGLQPVSVHLHIDGRSENASLLGERAEVARLERMMREANRGKVRR